VDPTSDLGVRDPGSLGGGVGRDGDVVFQQRVVTPTAPGNPSADEFPVAGRHW